MKLTQLSEAVRSFLGQVKNDEPVMVEDEQGRTRYGVIPYGEATAEEVRRADEALERIRAKVGRSMREQGVTEEDVDRVLQQDD